VLSEDGLAIDLSRDHKPENPGEHRRIKRAGSFIQDNRVNGTLGVSRALGDFKYKARTDLKPSE